MDSGQVHPDAKHGRGVRVHVHGKGELDIVVLDLMHFCAAYRFHDGLDVRERDLHRESDEARVADQVAQALHVIVSRIPPIMIAAGRRAVSAIVTATADDSFRRHESQITKRPSGRFAGVRGIYAGKLSELRNFEFYWNC